MPPRERDVESGKSSKFVSTTGNRSSFKRKVSKDDGAVAPGATIMAQVVEKCSLVLICLLFPLIGCFCYRQVQEYERAVIFRLGKLKGQGMFGPGLYFIIPWIDDLIIVDLRTVSFDVPAQELLTKDSVTVQVDAVVYYNVHSPLAAILNVMNFARSTHMQCATTLRNILGTKSLDEILTNREQIAKSIQLELDAATDPWGINVDRVEIKNVLLPAGMQRAMAAEAESVREARAKVVAAKGEETASIALKEASDVLSRSPAAIQLRYLQTLCTIASEKNSTIVFPIPIDLLSNLRQ